MPFLLQTRMITLNLMGVMILLVVNQGCSYRFSNLAMSRPYGLHNLAIEAVYDSTSDVLPHQILWSEIFRSFAARGKMKITSVEDADIILRPHIYFSSQAPLEVTRPGLDKDKLKGDKIYSDSPPYTVFKNLMEASSYTKSHSLSFNVRVDAWNVHTGKRIFNATYGGGISYPSVRESAAVGFTAQFLAFEEATHTYFRQVSKNIADKLVSDFYL